jgi:hypothetical protein
MSAFAGIVDGDDLFKEICGRYLGEGSNRIVYEHNSDPLRIVKVGKMRPHISNLTEWIIWLQVSNQPKLNQVFGECFALSASGRFLIMEKLVDLSPAQRASAQTPVWATDPKPSALGATQAGVIKVRDYGHVSLGPTLANPPLQSFKPDPDMGNWKNIIEKGGLED